MQNKLVRWIKITGKISSFIMTPLRILKFTFKVSNFKIVYKSGHVEKLFLSSIMHDKNGWNWSHFAVGKQPLILGVEEIVSVIQLY